MNEKKRKKKLGELTVVAIVVVVVTRVRCWCCWLLLADGVNCVVVVVVEPWKSLMIMLAVTCLVDVTRDKVT